VRLGRWNTGACSSATTTGIQVVNVLGLEEYVGGVVGAELGRRSPAEREAVAAQAILSRTVAYRALERRRLQAWDLMATVADQVYRGVAAETPEGTAAAAATRGMLVVWAGQPIDAFFHSTCGGKTATPEEVFVSAARPYLQSIRDVRGDGTAWCAASPRFRWREAWPAERLLAILRETLPSQGADPARLTTLRDLGVTSRTPSGRVQSCDSSRWRQSRLGAGVARCSEPWRPAAPGTAFDLIAVETGITASTPRAVVPATGSASASGAPSGGPGMDGITGGSWRRTSRGPNCSGGGEAVGGRGRRCYLFPPELQPTGIVMSEALRLGVVGAGAVLQVAHLPVLKKLKSV
jgi:SpoIID/LytB domain protein